MNFDADRSFCVSYCHVAPYWEGSEGPNRQAAMQHAGVASCNFFMPVEEGRTGSQHKIFSFARYLSNGLNG
jgi:hypothetical protein